MRIHTAAAALAMALSFAPFAVGAAGAACTSAMRAAANPAGNGHVDVAKADPTGTGHVDIAKADPTGTGHVDIAKADPTGTGHVDIASSDCK